MVLQVGSKGTDLQRRTTVAAAAEEQERQGTTGLPEEEWHKGSLVATPKQAPPPSSGWSDTEEGAPDLRLPCLYDRLRSFPANDRRHATARAPVATAMLQSATTIATSTAPERTTPDKVLVRTPEPKTEGAH